MYARWGSSQVGVTQGPKPALCPKGTRQFWAKRRTDERLEAIEWLQPMLQLIHFLFVDCRRVSSLTLFFTHPPSPLRFRFINNSQFVIVFMLFSELLVVNLHSLISFCKDIAVSLST